MKRRRECWKGSVSDHMPAAVQHWPRVALLSFSHALAAVLDLPAANLQARGRGSE